MIELSKEEKDKIISKMKTKLQGAQGEISSNGNVIRGTEERKNQEGENEIEREALEGKTSLPT